jgi:hypothetical protein
VKNTFDLGKLLGGDTAPTFDISTLTARLDTVLQAGKALAEQANTTMGTWDMEVKPAWDRLGKVLGAALDSAGRVLDINGLLGGKEFPSLDLALIKSRLADLIRDGTQIADAADAAIGEWDIEVKPSLDHLGKVLSSSISVIEDAMKFGDLQTFLLGFTGFNVALLEPKLDLVFAQMKELASRLGTLAENAGIKEEWQTAASRVGSIIKDGTGAINDTIKTAMMLADPSTVIPTIQQIQPKLTAVFGLIASLVDQAVSQAGSIGQDKLDQAAKFGDALKGLFGGIQQISDAVKSFEGISLGSSGFNNIDRLLGLVSTAFRNVAPSEAEITRTTTVISLMLGGLTNLAGTNGYNAGKSWGAGFADGLAAIAPTLTSAASAAIATITGGASPSGGGSTINNNQVYHNEKTFNMTLNVDAANGGAVAMNFSMMEALGT